MNNPNKYTEPFDREEDAEKEYGKPYSKEMRIIMQQWSESKKYWDKIYKVSRRDKRFLQGKQWDEKVEKERNRRGLATSTIPMIRNYYNHAVGGSLPSGIDFQINDIDSSTDKSNLDAEKILNGALRFIDKQSKSSMQRHKSRKDQFGAGIGWLGVDYVYSDNTASGEVKVYSPKYFDQIYIHPHFINPDASDCEYSFYVNKMPYGVAVAKYGDKIRRIENQGGEICDFEDFEGCFDQVSTLDHVNTSDWLNDSREVTIAVHHWRRKIAKVYYRFDGQEYPASQWREISEALESNGVDANDAQRIEKPGWIVEQRTICGWSILEEKEFFINSIPWTPVFGYTVEDGKSYTYHSVVHDAVNLQESINWLESQSCQKLADAKTAVFVPSGTVNNNFTPIASRGGVDYYSYDPSGDMTGNGVLTPIQSQDNGSVELQHMQARIDLLRDMMRVSNDIQGHQLVQSGAQLEVSIADRDVYLEELEINYKSALETHYSKVIKMIISVYGGTSSVNVIDLENSQEVVGKADFSSIGESQDYGVKVSMSPSGSVRRQQAQKLANTLMSTGDPAKINMGLMMSVENSDIQEKSKVMDEIYRQKFINGDISGIPKDTLEKIIQQQQESGQFQQHIESIASQMAQEKLQEMMQDQGLKVQLASAEAQIASAHSIKQKSNNDVVISDLKAEREDKKSEKEIIVEELKAEQEEEQTKQEELQVIREFLQVQSEIALARADGQQIEDEIIQKLLNITLKGSEI